MNLFDRLTRVRKERRQRSPEVASGRKLVRDGLGGREIKTAVGTYYLVELERRGELPFPLQAGPGLRGNLRLVRGIGPVTEARLRECGYRTLADLLRHPRWQEEAQTCLELIARRDFEGLRRRGATDLEILEFFRPEDLVFLDIESTGLWFSQPLFLVGLLSWREGRFTLKQFLARHYREEKALLAAVIGELAPFKVVVTFNGKKFDIPYIEGRTVAHNLFHRFEQEQVDLLFHARRCFRNHLPNCRLVTLEEWLLDTRRKGDIPGHLIPEVYHRFVQTQDPRLMRDILKHNAQDLFTLAQLLQLVTREGPEGLLAGEGEEGTWWHEPGVWVKRARLQARE